MPAGARLIGPWNGCLAIAIGLALGGGASLLLPERPTAGAEPPVTPAVLLASAETAALAAAAELDRTPEGLARAARAARAGAAGMPVAGVRFLGPSATAQTDDPGAARLVEVTVGGGPAEGEMLAMLGLAKAPAPSASATASLTRLACRMPPLWICSPADDGMAGDAPAFDIDRWRGRQARLAPARPGERWGPGTFGLLDAGQGRDSRRAAHLLATVAPDACFREDGVRLLPGTGAFVRTALNTRLDMYEAPYFDGTASANPNYRPAANVTKGLVPAGEGAGLCSVLQAPGPPTAMALPRDHAVADGGRWGDGRWDCAAYWAAVHPGIPAPAGCSLAAAISRYEVYRREIEDDLIPNTPGGENGNPQCYAGNLADIEGGPDRRVLSFAIVNCRGHGAGGEGDEVPVAAFARGFMTEPVGPGGELTIEFLDGAPEGAGGDWRDIVRLVR
jgi:hypothetical protein